jgi:hypothetical protein
MITLMQPTISTTPYTAPQQHLLTRQSDLWASRAGRYPTGLESDHAELHCLLHVLDISLARLLPAPADRSGFRAAEPSSRPTGDGWLSGQGGSAGLPKREDGSGSASPVRTVRRSMMRLLMCFEKLNSGKLSCRSCTSDQQRSQMLFVALLLCS